MSLSSSNAQLDRELDRACAQQIAEYAAAFPYGPEFRNSKDGIKAAYDWGKGFETWLSSPDPRVGRQLTKSERDLESQ